MTHSPPAFPGFSTEDMDRIWTPANLVGAILEFEAGLALALADTGLAPPAEAEAVAAACLDPIEDPERILASTWEAGTPLTGVVAVVKSRLGSDEERRWVHHGATTQDAIDTAHMLQARAALAVLEGSLARISRRLLELVESNRAQLHMGRTFLQYARPTTFGRRVAGWLETTLRHLQHLRHTRGGLSVQLGGAVGNLTPYGADAEQVVDALAKRLELKSPTLSWHSDRSRIWALVETVQAPIRTAAKIALDLALLAQSDVAEITLPGGGSSSMAEKRNPVDPIRA